ncbi:YfeC-like transcriptional regulator [Mixta sp. Marseille-Q2659]|uniref:YfeC-like transcriptional regulator n=1 Tax=Mixta sp. Marseille-Q2659 TaxID=2736607 RepID=UPI0023B91A32|nr:YfeC-like transcriptional regulator [Mixta sp. Marseille-Q2659]
MKEEWLTPDELAQRTGYTRQTINKWIKREQWTTKPKPGVQGGKARVVKIDERVNAFINEIRYAAEPAGIYQARPNTLSGLLLSVVQQMTPQEQQNLQRLLLREGVKGLLQRLDIESK